MHKEMCYTTGECYNLPLRLCFMQLWSISRSPHVKFLCNPSNVCAALIILRLASTNLPTEDVKKGESRLDWLLACTANSTRTTKKLSLESNKQKPVPYAGYFSLECQIMSLKRCFITPHDIAPHSIT